MRKLSEFKGKPVYVPKKGKAGKFERLGKVHMAVFSPEGTRLVGFLVRRPDIVGMVKRPDAFVALDAFEPVDGGFRVTMGDEAFDDQARKRLSLDWDRCIKANLRCDMPQTGMRGLRAMLRERFPMFDFVFPVEGGFLIDLVPAGWGKDRGIQILAECIQGRIEIPELEVQKTGQHMRIFGQHFFSPFGISVL